MAARPHAAHLRAVPARLGAETRPLAGRHCLGRESDLRRPAHPDQAGVQRPVAHAEFLCPLGDGLRTPLIGHHAVPARVIHLIALRNPAAVIRRVRTVTVNALNRQAVPVRGTHVVDKSVEHPPALAHLDSAAAIVRPVVGIRIRAAVPHVAEDHVKPRSSQLSSLWACRSQSVPAFRGKGAGFTPAALLAPPYKRHGHVANRPGSATIRARDVVTLIFSLHHPMLAQSEK